MQETLEQNFREPFAWDTLAAHSCRTDTLVAQSWNTLVRPCCETLLRGIIERHSCELVVFKAKVAVRATPWPRKSFWRWRWRPWRSWWWWWRISLLSLSLLLMMPHRSGFLGDNGGEREGSSKHADFSAVGLSPWYVGQNPHISQQVLISMWNRNHQGNQCKCLSCFDYDEDTHFLSLLPFTEGMTGKPCKR